MRILVTGPRDWTNGKLIAARLLLVAYEDDVTLIEGGATGFDALAKRAAKLFGWEVETYKPNYVRYPHNIAPPMRNQEMVDTGANVCVAGYLPCNRDDCTRTDRHGTHGTADCVSRAKEAGIPLSTIYGHR